ncbi:MAG TPA: heavy metal translocating P-type ATPase, partial [Firmicutes bacterium]|nr:heavy metal translocating P-type ATPase [Bacillota bacterium]
KAALKKKRNKVLLSVLLLLCLMVFSMGPMIFSYPSMDDPNYGKIMIIDIAIQFAFIVPIIILNFNHFSSGFKSLFHFHPNMDSLVALGSTVSLAYGIYSFVMTIIGEVAHDHMMVMNNAMNIYIESGAMIPTIVGLGKYLEEKATLKTSSTIASLIELLPDVATIKKNDKQIEIQSSELKEGDIVVVKPGQTIPCDGIVLNGFSHVDEASLTGESKLIKKEKNDKVVGATLNKEGSFEFKATSVGKNMVMSQIIDLVKEASQTKAPISRLADKISLVFVPTVMILSLITFIVWVCLGYSGVIKDNSNHLNLAFQLAISVLVISCPCALGLATPVSIMVGTGKGAEYGVLVRSAEAFERLSKVDTVVFDKTGTLTKGEMTVVTIKPFGVEEDSLLKIASELESKSEHPLARAIVSFAKNKKIEFTSNLLCNYVSGKGVISSNALIGNTA